ncbi:competence protein CoiA [Mesorhizobium temperatum]|uniref:Competence protein CoiA-like N-terminal domain-containing protein n=1 Tax=Mesorhizobium temperatum TaxID=241416 RepID=A0A271LVB1_9HYPH|nr:competence protein CoiA family protein [Mesorhizobium temperatum]PAQ11717.1 hypothetical protein CIT26_03370 [Mesorhizobium temperatum]
MQFALVVGQKHEASPGLAGHCPGCGQPVVAKCGDQRMWHWAHLRKRKCDRWWESETPWHRAWKENFAREWREVINCDQNGERHIADVRTALGLVLEFQHSRLDPQERAAREAFYGNMVWVVDGTRLKRDWPRFYKGTTAFRQTALDVTHRVPCPEERFPYEWLASSVPVFFDFAGDGSADEPEPARQLLWCLLPGRVDRYAVMIAVSRQMFLEGAMRRPQIIDVTERLNAVALELQLELQQQRDKEREEARRHAQWRSYRNQQILQSHKPRRR